VKWTIDDFERVRRKVPVLCDLKPSGKYVAVDFHRAGGVPQVLKILLDNGLLHGDCMTITGKTMAEELKNVPSAAAHGPGRDPAFQRPDLQERPPRILKGNLATEGCVAKITWAEKRCHTGPARVFDSETGGDEGDHARRRSGGRCASSSATKGRKACPGMQEMLAPTRHSSARDWAQSVGLLTDGRFSGGTWGMVGRPRRARGVRRRHRSRW
jgi:dihydroxy-acid dehydratase